MGGCCAGERDIGVDRGMTRRVTSIEVSFKSDSWHHTGYIDSRKFGSIINHEQYTKIQTLFCMNLS